MIFKLFWPLVQWQQQKIHLNVAPPCKRLILQDARLNFANKRRKDAISCWAVSNAQFNATPGPARGHNNFLAFENPKTTSQPYLWNLTDVPRYWPNTTYTASYHVYVPFSNILLSGDGDKVCHVHSWSWWYPWYPCKYHTNLIYVHIPPNGFNDHYQHLKKHLLI